MAYPITGELGRVVSVTHSTDLDQLFEVATRSNQITYNVSGGTQDVSGDGATSTSYIGLPREWSFDFEAWYPKAAPKSGNTGLVTYASGTTYFVSRYDLDFDFGEADCSGFDAAGLDWKLFRPSGRPVVTFNYTCHTPNDTAITLPTAANSGGAAATFKLCEDGAADPTISGNIIVEQLGQAFGGAGAVMVNYGGRFSGAVTMTAGTNLPNLISASSPFVVVTPNWGNGTIGPNTVQVVTQSVTGRTYTGHAWLRRLRISCEVGGALQITGTCRGFGALALA